MPSEKRIQAGRRNRALRGPLTDAGRAALRQAALANRPWAKSTGPTTAAGKAKAAANGKTRQAGPTSVRAARAAAAEARGLIDAMRAAVAAA